MFACSVDEQYIFWHGLNNACQQLVRILLSQSASLPKWQDRTPNLEVEDNRDELTTMHTSKSLMLGSKLSKRGHVPATPWTLHAQTSSTDASQML